MTLLTSKEFDARQLCSRKLWRLVNNVDGPTMSAGDLQQAINELAARRRYLAELAQIGKLDAQQTH